MPKRKAICLIGPTATGKTALAIALTKHLPVDLISVDSAMVYRDMNIGTAKPTLEEQQEAPHRLINLRDPAECYSAGQFCIDAHQEITAIHAQNRIPLLVGGTMLYFHLFQQGFSEFPEGDAEIRQALALQAKKIGWVKLHEQLARVDPQAAQHIHPNDPQRIQRALELYQITGQTMSELHAQQQWHALPFEVIMLILSPMSRHLLHERIALRVDKMLAEGLIAEVEALYRRGDLTSDMPSMRMINYRQVWAYLEGEYDLNELRNRMIYATRQFAKRQFTWLRRWKNVKHFDSEDPGVIQNILIFLRDQL